jgi:hypothetical protein
MRTRGISGKTKVGQEKWEAFVRECLQLKGLRNHSKLYKDQKNGKLVTQALDALFIDCAKKYRESVRKAGGSVEPMEVDDEDVEEAEEEKKGILAVMKKMTTY